MILDVLHFYFSPFKVTDLYDRCRPPVLLKVRLSQNELMKSEAVSGQSKETALVIYLAFLAKVANLYFIILTAI